MSDKNPQTVSETDIYREHYATYRQLNGLLYQFPILFSTILGGLYYFGFSYIDSNQLISGFVFLFSSLISYLFFIMIKRFGFAFSRYIDKINEFDGDHKITLKDVPGMSILGALRRLLCIVIFVGLGLAVVAYFSLFSSEKPQPQPYFICNNCVLQQPILEEVQPK